MCDKHFCQGLKGRERMVKRKPPKIRVAPAEPTQATDQDSSWYKGMEWLLDSNASTDWWNIRIERRINTPAWRERIIEGVREIKSKTKSHQEIIHNVLTKMGKIYLVIFTTIDYKDQVIFILPHISLDIAILRCKVVTLIPLQSEVPPDRMKQKEAGLRKKGTPWLRDMAIQMEPMAIMVRLKRAKIAAARFRSVEKSRETWIEEKE